MPPYCISRIIRPDGIVIYSRETSKYHVISEETSFLMTSMLKSAVEYGTSKRLKSENIELAAKTGTSGTDEIDGNKDSWVVAYNPEYAVCCWMGYDKTDTVHCLPKDITGGTYPALLVKSVFESIYKEKKAPVFTRPQSILEVKIDQKALEGENRVVMASAFTPADKTMTEYFTDETKPTEISAYWNVPEPPNDLTVEDSGNGYPLVSFTPKRSDIIYRLMRRQADSDYVLQIGEISGKSSLVSAIDYNVEIGKTYIYYIIPCHPELTVGSKPMAGPPSASVAYPPGEAEEPPF